MIKTFKVKADDNAMRLMMNIVTEKNDEQAMALIKEMLVAWSMDKPAILMFQKHEEAKDE